jgi:hypothetical protein
MQMRLSQGQLNLLEACPRRFQHTYLDRLGLPIDLEQQDRQQWGKRFHLLMQQRELELPAWSEEVAVDRASEDQQLQQCVTALTAAAPELFQPRPVRFRQSEHCRTLEFQGYLLTVIYDLVILEDSVAQILDWKTYPRPQNSQPLAKNWQTRLYPFVLAETTNYLPEQISMTYWFVQAQAGTTEFHPQPLRFHYSTALHQEIHAHLTALLDRLTNLLQHYEQGEFFPQVAAAADCSHCHFTVRCQREAKSAIDGFGNAATLAQFQEVALR